MVPTGYLTLDTESSISYELKNGVRKEGVHGPSFRALTNDLYTIIYGDHPDRIKLLHKKKGFARKIPYRVGKLLLKSHTLITQNGKFDLSYVWHDKFMQRWLKKGGKLWDCAYVRYILSHMRHAYPSLAEMQKIYLKVKTKKDRISYLFSKFIGADEIIAAKERCPRVWKLYCEYGIEDGRTPLLIFKEQYKEAKRRNMLPIIELFNSYLLSLTMMEVNGIDVDENQLEINEKIIALEELEHLEKAQNIAKKYWDDPRLPLLNINSNDHKSLLLFGGTIKCKVKQFKGMTKGSKATKTKEAVAPKEKYTTVKEDVEIKGFGLNTNFSEECSKKGFYKTGEEIIERIYAKSKNEEAKEFCKWMKLAANSGKMLSTYIRGIKKRLVNGKLHINLNNTKTVTTRLSSSKPNCFPGETEVLTPSGWVRIDQVTLNMQVLQVNPDTLKSSYTRPLKIIASTTTRLISFKSHWGQLLCTPDHRLFSTSKKGVLIEDTAEDWFLRWGNKGVVNIDRKSLRATFKEGGILLSKQDKVDLELAIIVQAEAEANYLASGGLRYTVRCSSQRKIEQLKLLGLKGKLEPSGRYRVNVACSRVSRWVSADLDKNFIAEEILALARSDLEWFVQVIHKWDGDYTRGCTYGQKQTKRGLSVDLIQAVCALVGKSTKLYHHPSKDFKVVNMHPKARRHYSNTEITDLVGDKIDVYCLTVPDGALLVRYNGSVQVVGNCQNIPSEGRYNELIQGLFIAPPGWTCVSFDFSQLEVYVKAWLSNDRKLIDDLVAGVDFHSLRACWFPSIQAEGITYEQMVDYAKKQEIPKYVKVRKEAKPIGFGKDYGKGYQNMAKDTGIPELDMKEIYRKEDEVYWQAAEMAELNQRIVEANTKISYKTDYAEKSTKGTKDGKELVRRFFDGYELLPIKVAKGSKLYEYDRFEPRHIGIYRNPCGLELAIEERATRTKTGDLYKYYLSTQIKNYPMQSGASIVQACTTVEMFQFLLRNPDKIKMLNEIHDSKWFIVKNEYLTCIVGMLSSIMLNVGEILKRRFNVETELKFANDAKFGVTFANMVNMKDYINSKGENEWPIQKTLRV